MNTENKPQEFKEVSQTSSALSDIMPDALAELAAQSLPEIPQFEYVDDAAKQLAEKMRTEVMISAPRYLDDEQAKKLSDLLNRRYAATRFNPKREAGAQYEVYTWPLTDSDEVISEADYILSGLHETQTEADKYLELFQARLVYDAIKQFMVKETVNFAK